MAVYVIDTSVVFNAFKDEELRRDIYCSHINFSAPIKLITELAGRKQKILDITGMREREFENIWILLQQKISLVNVMQPRINQAESILRNLSLSYEDKSFFALALYLKCPYWTLERKYTKSSSVANALRANGLVVANSIPLD